MQGNASISATNLNFTYSNAYEGAFAYTYGGSNSLTLKQAILNSNTMTYRALIYMGGASTTSISNSTISSNTADSSTVLY